MSDYVDKKILELKKASENKKKSEKEFHEKMEKNRQDNDEYFKSLFKDKEEEFLKLSEYLKQEFKETEFRPKSFKSGHNRFQLWIQKENKIIDIVNLNVLVSRKIIEVEIHDPKSTNLLDDGIIKEFKPQNKDKAFQYFIDKIIEASKRIDDDY
tara:strand:+ start:73 stop:534 length:462 start_codon:yes stop_codon:yes gene_type:complete